MFSNRRLPYAFDRPIVGSEVEIRKLNIAGKGLASWYVGRVW